MSRKANFFKDMRQVIRKNLCPMSNNYKEVYEKVQNFLQYQKHLKNLPEEANDTLIVYMIGEELIDWMFDNIDNLYAMNIIKKDDEDSIVNFLHNKIIAICTFDIPIKASKQLAIKVLQDNKIKIFKRYNDLTK